MLKECVPDRRSDHASNRPLEVAETVIDISARRDRSAVRSSEPPCACATRLEQVQSAWRLVYDRYSEMGLIDSNPFGIHAFPTSVGPHACVLWGPEGPDIGYTMTLFLDNPRGLALDSVYGPYLDELRHKGRRLLEIGLLADRRRSVARGMKAMFIMMRWATHFSTHNGVNDVVIGVHPRHAEFYARCYGFEEFAPPTTYPMVRDNPVVAMRCRLPELLEQTELPRGLADARDNPIPASAFAQRFAFEPEQLRGSLLANFMEARYGADHARSVATPEPAMARRAQSGRLLRTVAALSV